MSAKELVKIVVTGLEADLKSCSQLEDLLKSQRKCLSDADSSGLEVVNESIVRATERLSLSTSQRSSAMAKFGLSASRDGVSVLAEKLPSGLSSKIVGDFEKLEIALERCKTLNERNGDLLAGQRSLTDSLLGRETKLYGVTG